MLRTLRSLPDPQTSAFPILSSCPSCLAFPLEGAQTSLEVLVQCIQNPPLGPRAPTPFPLRSSLPGSDLRDRETDSQRRGTCWVLVGKPRFSVVSQKTRNESEGTTSNFRQTETGPCEFFELTNTVVTLKCTRKVDI